MPVSFDSPLTINPNGCLTPAGPLGLAAGETGLRLDIWILQDRAACMAFQLSPQGDRWTMNPDPQRDHFGEMFQPGAAIGMGLLVKRVDATGRIIVEQWNSPINLVAELKSG